jgi:16S rRNA (guanine527-N7)-methyltransferase
VVARKQHWVFILGVLRPLGHLWQPLLSRALAPFGLAPDQACLSDLSGWLDLLVAWNARIDLTAARDQDELVDLMVADAAILAASTCEGARWVDVGSGAGAPGFALALLRRDIHVTLVEPLQKRTSFLRTAIGKAATSRVEVVRGRGEDLATRPGRFDVAVSRATLPASEWLSLGARLVEPSGSVWVLLARGETPKLAGWDPVLDRAYAWPLTAAQRRVLRFERPRAL